MSDVVATLQRGLRIQPLETGAIHFVGIGGIGMSGIAEILKGMGYTVQGSDVSDNANVQRLRAAGMTISIGHAPDNLGEARVLVVSTAIKPDNPELEEARRRRLPIVRRADMLGEIMRLHPSVAVAGTHGKTTTTAIVAALFDAAGLEPTVINGGIINAYGTNARLGAGDWMVVEADESDGSFLRLPATIGIVTNIDPEHMEFWGDFDAVKAAYQDFVERLPFYGVAVLCIDHPEVQALVGRITDRKVRTYGFNPQADIRATEPVSDAKGSRFDVFIRDAATGESRRFVDFELALPGHHNVQNALAAIAIADQLGMTEATVRQALKGLGGVKRRFTVTGEVDGVTIVDDYGHHPIEIRAVLRTARQATSGRVIAVVQPHRFSRLRDLFEEFCTCFADADVVLVAPVYAAGEQPIEGIDRDSLVDGLIRHGQRIAQPIAGPEELPAKVAELAGPGDLVVCLGAGTISQWANALPEQLRAARGGEAGR
jgi:UDP-N-acetylmuramate--alanine ligase